MELTESKALRVIMVTSAALAVASSACDSFTAVASGEGICSSCGADPSGLLDKDTPCCLGKAVCAIM